MRLDPYAYDDLALELIGLKEDKRTNPNIFMLSGRECLRSWKNAAFQAKNIIFETNEWLKIEWDDKVETTIFYQNLYKKHILQWALLSVRSVSFWNDKPVPTDLINILMNNPNLKELKLINSDLSTTRPLIESRIFDYIYIGQSMVDEINGLTINAKELEVWSTALKPILRSGSIKMNSLVIHYQYFQFPTHFFTLNINPNFQFLERLELIVNLKLSQTAEGIIQFLEFANIHFPNLQLCTLQVRDRINHVGYNRDEDDFTRSPNYLRNFLNYEEQLAAYNGKLNVKLNHYLCVKIIFDSKQALENYINEARNEFWTFQYSSEDKGLLSHHYFINSCNIKENFQLNVQLELRCTG